ncbi:MAG: cytochrome C oxidase subunit IV family protein [Acidimicrobiales bacterium]|nr:cytochrome C oxidase subunit IV family protein [Acidimicrobiales bacterium]
MAVHHPPQPTVPAAVLDGAVADYPRDRRYWIVALVLGGLTVIEVLTYVFKDSIFKEPYVVTPTLLVLMALKFWIVAGYFMHLKFDKRLLTVAFYSGIVLAILVYLATLTVFRFWWPTSSGVNCSTTHEYSAINPDCATPKP